MAIGQPERAEVYSRFVERYGRARWNETIISRPIPEHDVAELQQKLGVVFPESLRLFLRNHGDVAVPELSRTWLFSDDRTCPVPIEEFFGYDSMPLANQTAWLAPIPASISGGRALPSADAFDYLVSFAGDDGGNWFCFKRAECVEGCDDPQVYYFDHDGGAIEEIAEGLDELLMRYLALPDKTVGR